MRREGRQSIQSGSITLQGADLQLRNKAPTRWVKARLREDRADATQSNQVWAMDFVHDQLATGRKIRVLTVVDTFSPFAPVVDPRFSYRGEDVVKTLELACKTVGYPTAIRVDQGSEFISRDLNLCGPTRRVSNSTSRGRKGPTHNAFIVVQRQTSGGMPERPLVP